MQKFEIFRSEGGYRVCYGVHAGSPILDQSPWFATRAEAEDACAQISAPKLLAEISMIQRTALGGKDAPRDYTTLYVVRTSQFYEQQVEIMADCKDWLTNGRADLVGIVRVEHPALMVGSREEILRDFSRAAEKELLSCGIVKQYADSDIYCDL